LPSPAASASKVAGSVTWQRLSASVITVLPPVAGARVAVTAWAAVVGVAGWRVAVDVAAGRVAVGGTAVAVGGATVFVGGTAVAVGGTAVLVGGTAVFVGGTAVLVAGTGVFVGGGVAVDAAPPQAARSRISPKTVSTRDSRAITILPPLSTTSLPAGHVASDFAASGFRPPTDGKAAGGRNYIRKPYSPARG
jgi:hypothetical protein